MSLTHILFVSAALESGTPPVYYPFFKYFPFLNIAFFSGWVIDSVNNI